MPDVPFTLDPNGALDWFVELTEGVVSWLAPSGTGTSAVHRVFNGDPGAVYSGPMPYMCWTTPEHSIAPGLSGEVGSRIGSPNIYIGSYRESAYVDGGQPSLVVQRRISDTYAKIGAALVSPFGRGQCPPKGQQMIEVRKQHGVDVMFIDTGNGPMYGCLVIVSVAEVYND